MRPPVPGRSMRATGSHFPSFSEGLSLRPKTGALAVLLCPKFPFLFGGTFIEAFNCVQVLLEGLPFPFLFGGTFIEATIGALGHIYIAPFPFLFGGTFIEAA